VMGKVPHLNVETLTKILDNIFDEVVVVDQNDIVIYANQASEKHYCERHSTLIGKHVSEIATWSEWEPNSLPISKKEKKRITVEQTSPYGEKIITTATPVLNKNKKIELIVFNVRDIKQLESVKQCPFGKHAKT
jgi:PAS domain S-box-containing protein